VLEDILLGTVVVQRHPLRGDVKRLRSEVARASAGDRIGYAIVLDTPLFLRLVTVATFRWQVRRAERTITRGGGEVVARYGVDPSLEAPTCVYELNSPASEYADGSLRPRGSALGLRRFITRWCGCDPGLGGVLVVGKKPCS